MATMTILAQSVLTCDFTPPARLGDLLVAQGISIAMPCAGRGTCGKCRVLASGALMPPTDAERSALTDADIALGYRLACQATATGDVTVTVPQAQGADILTAGDFPDIVLAPWGTGLGMAVDIGTTTVAAFLYDLRTGTRLAVASMENPQAAFGADVISRLDKSIEGQGAALQRAIQDGIASLAASLCAQASVPVSDIHCAVLAGNTAMQYLLCGLSPVSITRVPFTLDEPFGLMTDPVPLGLPPDAKVFLPRCISAYVGADITMALLSSRLYANGAPDPGDPALLIDIGTNGEMVLCAQGRLLACSTAAGPAFEGAGIHQGMTAREGAIVHVTLDGAGMHCQTIGDTATGICGSGLIDAVAAMLDAGILDETGMMETEGHAYADYMEEYKDQPAFRLPGTQVILIQADIRAVQLAKSAIHAGILALLDAAGLATGDVRRLLIAGGFGSSIVPAAAERIGLIPKGYAAISQAIGNAAGSGACMTLLSSTVLEYSNAASRACETIELAANDVFMDQFVEQMMFE